MFRELSAAPDLKSPRDDVSLFPPACFRPSSVFLPHPFTSFLFLALSPSLLRLFLLALLCQQHSLVPTFLLSATRPIRTLKSSASPERGPPRSLDSWGISGWIRKLIKDGALSLLPLPLSTWHRSTFWESFCHYRTVTPWSYRYLVPLQLTGNLKNKGSVLCDCKMWLLRCDD